MKKILIIEDEIDIRENLVDILSMNGYKTITAVNGKEGLFMATTQKPDLILSDVSMPEMDGFQLLEYLKENNVLANVPFIFLTANNMQTSLRKGMTLGADDYLIKPVKMGELLNVVERRLKQADAIKKQFETHYKDIFSELNNSASHEFYTPLNAILGFAELILINNNIEPEKLKTFAEIIIKSGYRLKDTLDNILYARNLITKNKNNYINSNFFEVDIWKEWANIVSRKYERINDVKFVDLKNLNLKIEIKDINKIYTEILDNAFKFSKPGETIEITVNENDTYNIITITDNGIGMTDEQISKIGAFQQFERKKREQQGLGLGLFIANETIERYNGKLEIDNKTNTKGLICSLLLEK